MITEVINQHESIYLIIDTKIKSPTNKMKPTTSFGILAALLCALFLATFAVAQDRNASANGDIALNNVISIAIGNALASGDFKTIQLTSNDVSAAANSCRRRSWSTVLSTPSSFTGRLLSVYNSGSIRVGVASLHNDTAFFDANDNSGYLGDVTRIMASHMGLVLGRNIAPVFVPFNLSSNFFDDAVALLGADNGSVDTVIDVTFLTSRLNRSDFTCAYEAAIPFAVYRDENVPLPSIFSGKAPTTLEGWNNDAIRVATVPGTVYAAAADKYLPLAQKVFFNSANEAFEHVGTDADITFYDTASLNVFNSARNNETALVLQEGTEILFAGGTGFITRKPQ